MFYVQVRHGNSMPLNMSSSLDVFRCLLVTNQADQPVLDRFKLIDFAIIIGVPERTSKLKRFMNICADVIYMAFHFKSCLIFRPRYSASSYDMSG